MPLVCDIRIYTCMCIAGELLPVTLIREQKGTHPSSVKDRTHALARQHSPSTWSYGESLSTMSESEPLKSRTLSSRAMLLRAFSTCPGARKLCLMLSKVLSAAAHFAKASVIYNRSTASMMKASAHVMYCSLP